MAGTKRKYGGGILVLIVILEPEKSEWYDDLRKETKSPAIPKDPKEKIRQPEEPEFPCPKTTIKPSVKVGIF